MKALAGTWGLIKSIWFILTLDCRGSATLCSKRLDQKLSFVERVAVEAHLLICKKSRRLNRQLRQLQQMLTLSVFQDSKPRLKNPSKIRMREAIQKELRRQSDD